MVILATCCAAAIETSSSTVPYRRLARAKSKIDEIDNVDRTTSGASPSPPEVPNPPLSRSQSRTFECLDADLEDTVVVKVAMFGDSETGKTSFMVSYVDSREKIEDYVQTIGMISMEKSLKIQNAKIVFSIWELGGHRRSLSMLPIVCKDAAVMLFLFDLTRRSTLHSVKEWFFQARLRNKTAIPILIGTKYDQFVNFPDDIQVTITRQAMHYAQTMRASLFFSSITHNINVRKIFKVIVAKLFDLPCNISKNHNFGEPIVDY
ncbi:hypothetical protein O6H91_18G006800 [Diphasiastrum complanatum]|uniref:Uncharacterized protein n=1 Tax=Diphasiastrum complanatum TaxID=34168 RepID=A0ACC2AXX9_DIPCM|nr:hypothetical protein O6H91_18G006800 [Diphasiastrum complanatum]